MRFSLSKYSLQSAFLCFHRVVSHLVSFICCTSYWICEDTATSPWFGDADGVLRDLTTRFEWFRGQGGGLKVHCGQLRVGSNPTADIFILWFHTSRAQAQKNYWTDTSPCVQGTILVFLPVRCGCSVISAREKCRAA